MTSAEILKMSVLDRLQAMEELWDSLRDNTEEIKSPNWHGDILRNRKEIMEAGHAKFLSLEELKLKNRK